jgi:hypothetical protein
LTLPHPQIFHSQSCMAALDPLRLAAEATRLDDLLTREAPAAQDAGLLREALSPLLAAAKAGLITETVDFVPGARFFVDGELHDLLELGQAYSAFEATLTGIRTHPRYADAMANVRAALAAAKR